MTTPRDVADRFVDRIREVPERFIPVRDATRIIEDVGLVAWSLHATTVFEEQSLVLVLSNASQLPIVSGTQPTRGPGMIFSFVAKKQIDEDSWEVRGSVRVERQQMVL